MDGNRTGVAVLLVEDDPGDARLLRQTLNGTAVAGHVGTLADAVAWLEENRADVVLLDLGLPDSIGLATLSGLLAAHASTPVVVLSGTDDDTRARAAVEGGAQEYLVKGSVDTQVMGRTLRHAVERHRLQTELRERAKEMTGLYAITQSLQADRHLDQMVEVLADRLREAMQWPNACRVTVTLDGATATAGPDGGPHLPSLTAAVERAGRPRGQLEVRYVEDRPFLLPHEQDLLDAAADTIGVWLGRQDSVHQVERSEERLRVLVSQLPGLVWTADTELRCTSYDGALLAELDIDPDALVGVPLADVLESDPPGRTLELLQQALAGTPVTFERRWRGRWFRNHLEPKRSRDGEIVGVVCLSMDVTEEMEHAVELAETRARLEGLFHNASDAMLLADDTGRHLDANPAACQLTGRTREELLGLHLWDLSAEDDELEVHRARWQHLVDTGSMAGEHLMVRGDGSTVVTEFRAVAGIVPGVHLSILRDITSRKEAESALAASEERFRTMAEAAQDAIYRVRTLPHQAMEYLNPATTAISGFGPEDFRANPWLYVQRTHPDDVHLLAPARLRPGATETVTVRFRHADGHWVWLEDSRSPIIEDDRTVGVQGVIRDVTSRRRTQQALQEALEAERRAAEQLRSADRVKSHFLQAVSHELRTPLTAVLGMAATLVDRGAQLGEQETAYFQQRVLANARKLDRLLSDLLDLERLEHGAAKVDRRSTDLPALVARVAQEIEFGGRHVTVEEQPVVAHVDPDRVERIVHNLLTNAVKHTPPGTRITVRCETDDEAATIEVTDDGPGIPSELALAIFEPFRQGPRSYEAASPGTGIGLSIVRQFAALHGGTAWVRETPGGGATFTVRLPAGNDAHDAFPLDGDHGVTTASRATAATPATSTTTAAPATSSAIPPGLMTGSEAPPAGPASPAQEQRQGPLATRTATLQPTPSSTPPDGDAIAAWATRELLTAGSRSEVVGVLLRVVHQLGGWTVPARVADEGQALPIDISLGTSEPLLPAAEPTSVARMLLERHLPQLIADARHAADTIAHTHRLTEAADTDGLHGPPDRARFQRLQARRREHDVIVILRIEDLEQLEADHGHTASTAVARAFATCLRDVLRTDDEAARLSGDVFAVLLRETDRDGTAILLERLLDRWERHRPHPVDFIAEIRTP